MSGHEEDLKLEAAQEAFERLAAGVGSTLELPGGDVLSAMIFAMADLAARVTPSEQRAALRRELPVIVGDAVGRAFDRAEKLEKIGTPPLTALAPIGRA